MYILASRVGIEYGRYTDLRQTNVTIYIINNITQAVTIVTGQILLICKWTFFCNKDYYYYYYYTIRIEIIQNVFQIEF